jgi:hypothetical protein
MSESSEYHIYLSYENGCHGIHFLYSPPLEPDTTGDSPGQYGRIHSFTELHSSPFEGRDSHRMKAKSMAPLNVGPTLVGYSNPQKPVSENKKAALRTFFMRRAA